MGKHIRAPYFGQGDMFDLYNMNTGIVNFIAEINLEHSDPEVFVTAGTSCNITKIGVPIPFGISGSGAGLRWEDSYYATIGETIERYSMTLIHPEDLVFATPDEMAQKGLPFVGPGKWSLFDEKQEIAPYVMFKNDTPVTWVLADSLTDKTSKYVPACFVYLPYYMHFKEQGEEMLNMSLSTGASCATSTDEATLKGLCELIERDAFMIMWKNQLACPKISIDEHCGIYEQYLSRFVRPGLQYDIYYTTMDLGVHSFFGVLTDYRGEYVSRVVGGAAHPDPERAVLKTLLELVQGFVWKQHKKHVDFPVLDDFSNVNSFKDRMDMYAYNDLSEAFRFLPTEESVSLSSIALTNRYKDKNTTGALQQVIAEFREMGYDVLGVNLTTPEAFTSGVHVVKVVVPDLELMDGEHSYQYLGGKRWKEVPYKMNMKKYGEPLILNPFPHPYP